MQNFSPCATVIFIFIINVGTYSAANSNTATSEITQVQSWAEENNLTLNCQKPKEIIFAGRGTRHKSVALPTPCLGINQIHSLTALGVVLNDKLTAADHVSSLDRC